ncbi:Fur family transcriptional regulator [Thermoanaerobacterium thermosaccharolyticum]|uniref:Fe2+/Zn2+ uptake regulation protein n=1 Tax=Thermoanaerobacterium thermosaccharolyticum M0795 TaxID=698948 RepID=L0IKB3_THETR|nr:Fur family transcriptional regulator [Thermoanaerobacterium thermosaccharolyticum]AGB19955.1 Fe2+/Zn2+ uptake regulation protein [Thermoanaerobacterium thermosaccharolyticum M0795]
MTKEEILNAIKTNNFKITPQRELIINIMLDTQGYLSVKEIYEKVKKSFPQVSLDTVYRNLSLLKDINVLSETTIGNNIMYEIHKDMHDHIMKCIKCGKVYELNICPLDLCINKLDDFEIVDHKIEITGYCKNCKKTIGGSNS